MAAAAPSIAWLTYDSRSGSTSLSRRLNETDGRLWVTPEIGFDTVIRWEGDRGPGALAAMAAASASAGDWVNLGLDACGIDDAVAEAAAVPGADRRAALVEALLVRAARARGAEAATHFLVKNGTHLRIVPQLREAFGGSARMVFLARDPRAVAESKLRTRRPYRPWETFAWGGALHAAVRWRNYARLAQAASAGWPGMLMVRFEDFAHDPAAGSRTILAHLGLDAAHATAPRAYAVPGAERGIHARAAAGRFDAASLEEWRSRLPSDAQAVVERVCAGEMRALGYAGGRGTALSAALPFAREGLRSGIGIARHVALGWWHRNDPMPQGDADA